MRRKAKLSLSFNSHNRHSSNISHHHLCSNTQLLTPIITATMTMVTITMIITIRHNSNSKHTQAMVILPVLINQQVVTYNQQRNRIKRRKRSKRVSSITPQMKTMNPAMTMTATKISENLKLELQHNSNINSLKLLHRCHRHCQTSLRSKM